jgi:protein SCO1
MNGHRQSARRAARSAPFASSAVTSSLRAATAVCAVLLTLAAPASAQMAGKAIDGYKLEPGTVSSAVPSTLRDIGFDQNLDRLVPLDVPFVDEAGRTVRLADYFGRRPVVLVFAYYTCPMLCSQVVNGLASALNVLSLTPGRDFEMISISFDPHDTPATASVKKAAYLERYKNGGAAAASHFLSGTPESIARTTKAAGFRYAWDERTKQFAHPTGIIVLTPEGRLARYLFGIEFSPRDLQLAVDEASAGKVGSAVDALLLYCYHYDPATGRYGFAIMGAIRLLAVATVLALGTFMFVMLRKERHAAPLS